MENEINNSSKNWSLCGIWNEKLVFGREKRKLEPRERIWASEIGKNPYERYLKMTAVPPDFDYNERTLRKFEAGNFFERIVGFVLISAGLLIYDNKWYEIPADEDHLKVSLRPDFIAGGKPDWDKAKKDIDEQSLFKLMPNLKRIAEGLIEKLSQDYPDGLKKLVFEIKSVNSQVFWAKKDYLSSAYPHHRMQCFAEMKATNMPEGRIFYISKDDLTTAEFPLFLNDPKLIEAYEKDVRYITKCIKEKTPPPKPAMVRFDDRKKLKFQYNKTKYVIEGCYTENWEIKWSNYICQITGLKKKTPEDTKESIVARYLAIIKDEIKTKNEKLKEEFKAKL